MSDESKPQEWQLGQHILRVQPPDIVEIIFIGDVSGAEMEAMNEKPRAFLESGRYFSLLNLEQLGSLSAEAKQKIRAAPFSRGVAAFGASFQTRIMVSLLGKVYSMIKRGAIPPVLFVNTEQEAHAWIAERRKIPPQVEPEKAGK
jgi:hypothetical protein